MSEPDTIDLLDEIAPEPVAKRSRAPLLTGAVLSLLLGGGGFFATYSGMVSLPHGATKDDKGHAAAHSHGEARADMPAFVPVGEVVIPLGPNATARFLVIELQIEARPEDAAVFETLRPRILDVVNTFLRVVEESDIESPSATIRLRAQLLRRIRAVSAPVEPRDLLITSFVLK
ncbi:MAG: flagellar basal body-associated FliL family protein [Paracoccaceae bacterium]